MNNTKLSAKIKLRAVPYLLPIPRFVARRAIASEAARMAATIAFMTPEHHAVRNFAVTEIAATGAPVSIRAIADALTLPEEKVRAIVDELESRMVFLWCGDRQAVSWAYPVTSDKTPHRIEYADAKPTYGA